VQLLSLPNYQNYSDKELNQALASINSQTYPENIKSLADELTRRQQSVKTQNSADQLSNKSSTEEKLKGQAFLKGYWDPDKAKREQKKVSRRLGYAANLAFLGVSVYPFILIRIFLDSSTIGCFLCCLG
jgi:hypothetical protein